MLPSATFSDSAALPWFWAMLSRPYGIFQDDMAALWHVAESRCPRHLP